MDKHEKAKLPITFAFYRCAGDRCGVEYAIKAEETEEPCCPACSGPYFEHIADKEIII